MSSKATVDGVVKDIKDLTGKYGVFEIFNDLIECIYIAYINAYRYDVGLESKYMDIVSKHDKRTMHAFRDIHGKLIDAMNNKPRDLLGEIYMKLDITNKNLEQYYSPPEVGEVMARILGQDGKLKQAIKEKGYAEVYEPTCGSGGLIIEYWNRLIALGYNPQTQLKIEGWDIDLKACKMCFIQLSMLGANAIVRNIDTIRLSEWHTFATANYYHRGRLFTDFGK